MGCRIVVEADAVDRLAELGLTVEQIERAIRRAEAEASMCTPLDPPIMEGLTRWGRTNRFLREELDAAGWTYDNPRNLPRTIHPSGEFAIVATTGDILGLPEVLPRTKYPKGFATAQAVEVNGQLALDFGDFDLGHQGERPSDARELLTWLLLFEITDRGIQIELSLPDAIDDGWITSWAERIILTPFPRDDDRLADLLRSHHDEEEDVVVAVSRR